MKAESASANPFILRSYRSQPKAQEYFYSGERVGPGRYICTFCGKDVVAEKSRVLPPCGDCDSSQFALDAVAA